MSQSLNEIAALAKKATRGAGRDWGVAEEASHAVRWLAGFGLPGGETLALLLSAQSGRERTGLGPQDLDGVWQARDGSMCPVMSGASLSDCAHEIAGGKRIEMAEVAFPILCLPFAADVARHIKAPVQLGWDECCVTTDGASLARSDQPAIEALAGMSALSALSVSVAPATQFDWTARIRGTVSEEATSVLTKFAERTYAPATEESRQRGAGAGTNDND